MRGSRSGSISIIPIENERRDEVYAIVGLDREVALPVSLLFELLNLGAVTI